MGLMNKVLGQALQGLGKGRGVYHSEADFQFALAWETKQLRPDADIRLEIPLQVGSRAYEIELLFRVDGKRVAVELKYFKAPLIGTVEGEHYRFQNGTPLLTNRYDVVKDIMRLEHLLSLDYVDEAYAIVLTNQSGYWKPGRANSGFDAAFRIEEGRSLTGILAWGEGVGGTASKRERPLELHGSYDLHWRDFSTIPDQVNGLFRVLVVEAQPGQAPALSDPKAAPKQSKPTRIPPSRQRSRVTHDYSRLAQYLAPQSDPQIRLSFSEIEALVGELPKSATIHSAWWSNHAKNPQARWMDVGWKISEINQSGRQITFRKA